MTTTVAIIGAGPAGLTAAYPLAKRGIPVTVIESDPQHVGGLCRHEQGRAGAQAGASGVRLVHRRVAS